MDTSSDPDTPFDPDARADLAIPADGSSADDDDRSDATAAAGDASSTGRIVVIDTSGGVDRPAGPVSSRLGGARQGDTHGRAEMPLAPKEQPSKRKRGDTGYQKAKKVKPIKGAKATAENAPAPRRSTAMVVMIVLLLVAAGSMLYIRQSESIAPEDAMLLALDGKQFQATASFGIDLPVGSMLTLSFTSPVAGSGQLSVSGGCNQIGGTFELAGGFSATGTYGGTLRPVTGWTQTDMACDQPLMDLDDAVVDLLNSEPRLSLVGATLTVTVADAASGPRSLTLDRLA